MTNTAEVPETPGSASRLKIEQIRTVFAGSPRNMLSGIAAAIIIALAALDMGDRLLAHPAPLIWFALLCVGLVRGTYISVVFAKKPRDQRETLLFGKRLVWNGALCAFMWGAASWLLLPQKSLDREAFIIIAIAMVLMGGAGAQAAYRPLVRTFSLVTTIVFITGLLRFPDRLHLLMVVAFCLYCYVTLMFASNQEESIRDQVILKMEKEQLLQAAEVARTQSEEARSQAEIASAEAEAANRTKTTFLAAVSHDLRQPLHALEQYVAHLREANHDPALSETVLRISQSTDAAQALLNSVLEWAKITSGTIKPALATFDLANTLELIGGEMRPLAVNKGLRLDVSACGTDTRVHTDELLLQRILRNLTLNAIRYTNHGRVLMRCMHRGNRLRCQIWDNGIGISKEELPRIYEPFYQIYNNARDRRKGLGLGLAIVRQLCDLLGLRIRVRSSPGKGTVFMVDIPISSEQLPQAHMQPVHNVGDRDFVKGAFVVLIDDEQDSCVATAFTLHRFGCRVIAASSGLDAVAKLQGQEFRPHLIVADYRLVGESGIDAIRMVIENLRALYGDDFEIPAFLISGDTKPEELENVRRAGYMMLHKPVSAEAMHVQLNELLQSLALRMDG
jgi:two-component system, sensor histidine kinase